MKKLIYISLLASASLFASCEDLLDAPSKSSMDETIIFNTEALADAAVMGIHQSFGETNSYRGRYLAYFGVNTDCEIRAAPVLRIFCDFTVFVTLKIDVVIDRAVNLRLGSASKPAVRHTDRSVIHTYIR